MTFEQKFIFRHIKQLAEEIKSLKADGCRDRSRYCNDYIEHVEAVSKFVLNGLQDIGVAVKSLAKELEILKKNRLEEHDINQMGDSDGQ